MDQQWSKLINSMAGSFSQFSILDAIDILMVVFVIYQLLVLTHENRAMQVLKGMGALLLASIVTKQIGLSAIAWILEQSFHAGSIAVIVIFQPELRRALESIGRGRLFGGAGWWNSNDKDYSRLVDELATAMCSLSDRFVGALIVLERKTGLGESISSGTRIDGLLSSALIEQIFEPNTPLHDGAVIIRGDKIAAAGCFLPLTDNRTISRQLGTRHRAALGVSEVSDCLAFIVSEETGLISVANNGALKQNLDKDAITETLRDAMEVDDSAKGWVIGLRDWLMNKGKDGKDR